MGEKKVQGRKRHYLVDTEGHLLAILVHEANVNDREGARWVLVRACGPWQTLQKLWADQGYTGDLADWVQAEYGINLEIVMKPAEQQGFAVLPRRWVVERTIGWMGRSRRLSKDYEHWPEYSESWIYLASIHLLLKRLAPDPDRELPYAPKVA
jgi:putative transposase